jgi:hypothetical protein
MLGPGPWVVLLQQQVDDTEGGSGQERVHVTRGDDQP